jgi:hypothetical protein
MAGGEHRAGTVEQARGEVELIGRRQPDLHDVEALGHDAVRECRRKGRRARAHVVADRDLGCAVTDQPRERTADVGDESFVEFLTHQSADVIRLDDAVHSRGGPRHRAPCEGDCWPPA